MSTAPLVTVCFVTSWSGGFLRTIHLSVQAVKNIGVRQRQDPHRLAEWSSFAAASPFCGSRRGRRAPAAGCQRHRQQRDYYHCVNRLLAHILAPFPARAGSFQDGAVRPTRSRPIRRCLFHRARRFRNCEEDVRGMFWLMSGSVVRHPLIKRGLLPCFGYTDCWTSCHILRAKGLARRA